MRGVIFLLWSRSHYLLIALLIFCPQLSADSGGGATITTDTATSQPVTPEDLKPLGFAGDSKNERNAPPAPIPDGVTGGFTDFLPVPDRWRIGIPGDYVQNVRGNPFDPYNQNIYKGDYPIIGQDKFLILTGTSDTLFEARRLPVPSGVSSIRPGSFPFFGVGRQQLVNQNLILSADFFQGDAGYKPRDWELKGTIVANANYVHVEETGLINTDVRDRRDRADGDIAVQELFAEKRLADISPNFDFVSLRVGVQGFNSDFRGFLFSDDEPGVRLFGTYDNNQLQFNLAWFSQLEKDTNSGLNTFRFRQQTVFIANMYRQDFLFPGYTAQLSFQTNLDNGSVHYDKNGVIVRPAPIGTIATKDVHAFYFGWAGDGHIGPVNITHQFYEVLGEESFNPIANQSVNINAQFAAVELSYDKDWIRYRASAAYASGDDNPEDGYARGFDSIFDNPNFAGGGFNFFTRQAIRLTGAGVNLVNRNSFVPDLRTSKEQGQANFVNPGLFLYNIGMDMDLTPKLKLITNVSYLQFADTSSLQLLLNDNKIGRDIGLDLSVGLQYRPLLNNNIILTAGAAALVPASGFRDIYSSDTLYSTFLSMTFTY
jgi:hypothetical protein